MIVPVNAKAEKALREAIGELPRVEENQIGAPLAALTEGEHAEAIALSLLIPCYVVVEVCGSEWPDDDDLREFAQSLASVGTTAERLQLDADQVYAYLSRTVFGPDLLEDVIPDRAEAERLAIIVAQRAVVVYSPKEMDWWVYLDQIESAIEIASALDATVLPAAVMRAYLPRSTAEG